jgi:hypothetical protein
MGPLLGNRAITLLSLALGLSLLVRTTLLIHWKRRWLRDAARATGRVLHLETETRRERVSDSTRGSGMAMDDVTYSYPHVQFTAENGTVVTFRSGHGYSTCPFGLNAAVPIVYERRDPAATAQIEEGAALWQGVAVWVFFTFVALVFAAVQLFTG